MTDQFRKLTADVWASPQITEDDVREAARLGCAAIVNNRPEGESHDQTAGPVIAEAARLAGLAYHAIPIDHSGISDAQIAAMRGALDSASGPLLAYCRSGTRSTLLWAIAEAGRSGDLDAIAANARAAGYDVSPVMPLMERAAR